MKRTRWSNQLAFILAAIGSAVGLGNIWKFPYIAGENGGGAFVLVYLVCIAAIGIPIFIAELFIGQHAQCNAVAAFEKLTSKGTPWRVSGWIGVLAAFLILSFYSVVGGWVLSFLTKGIANRFVGQPAEVVRGYMASIIGDAKASIFWHTVFMAIVIGIVIMGIKDGVERWNKVLMPGFFALLVALFVRAAFLPGFPLALTFLFAPDTSRLTAAGILEAVGHSFFTLSVGMGAIITYGSYLGEKQELPRIAFLIGLADTLVAMIAGVVIFSIVFSAGLKPEAGPTLMFQTLPVLFASMAGGYYIAVAFFLLVLFAAVTSAVSLLEVVVAYVDEHWNLNRTKGTLLVGGVIYTLGLLCATSNNLLSHVTVLGYNFFSLFDTVSSNYLLPIGGLLISLFYGWVLGKKAIRSTLGAHADSPFWLHSLLWCARILAPVGVFLVLLNSILPGGILALLGIASER
ncbi:MAG: sodium-dependent transporter [Bdellovibrionaceae bacterium]|nr:sodium-dependent transporter [Pseudobdellovibrionaceae bacterium]